MKRSYDQPAELSHTLHPVVTKLEQEASVKAGEKMVVVVYEREEKQKTRSQRKINISIATGAFLRQEL